MQLFFSDEPIKDLESLITEIKQNNNVIEAVPYISFQALITNKKCKKLFVFNGIDKMKKYLNTT